MADDANAVDSQKRGAAVLMVKTRCISAASARRSMSLDTLLIIAASFGIAKAMENTGLATSLVELGRPLLARTGRVGALAGHRDRAGRLGRGGRHVVVGEVTVHQVIGQEELDLFQEVVEGACGVGGMELHVAQLRSLPLAFADPLLTIGLPSGPVMVCTVADSVCTMTVAPGTTAPVVSLTTPAIGASASDKESISAHNR